MNFETLSLYWNSYLALQNDDSPEILVMFNCDVTAAKITPTRIKMNTVLYIEKNQKLFVHSRQKFNHDKIKKGMHSFFEQTLK